MLLCHLQVKPPIPIPDAPPLDVIHIHHPPTLTLPAPVLIKLHIPLPLLIRIRIRLVDLRALGQLVVRLQTPRLVGRILQYHIALLVLVVAQREEDDVALVDPDFLAELAADVREAAGAVEAEGFEAAVAEHFEDLRVFWEGFS